MESFSVSAWFDVDIDVPGDPESAEYQHAIDVIIKNLENSHAQLTTPYDTYYGRVEADYLG